ncbi:MAG TPA: hypothetical protein VKM55_26660 [Candidatus Lokiarchaeia archaeon]|nr:hypothetical protein [Candidatus Lokiarchaeia archaeon]
MILAPCAPASTTIVVEPVPESCRIPTSNRWWYQQSIGLITSSPGIF